MLSINQLSWNSKYFVYALIDPYTIKIRYIGKSCKGIKRPLEHLQSCRLKYKSKKNSWIKSVLRKGKQPITQILKPCRTSKEASEWEIKLIKFYKNETSLTNMTDGGTGGNTGGSYKKWKPIESKNLRTGKVKKYPYIWATEKDGFSPTKVVAVCKGRRYSHHGYSFRYLSGKYYKPKNYKLVQYHINKYVRSVWNS